MKADEIRATALAVLAEVVPGTDPAAIAPNVNFRDQVDMDSMDFLNLVIALHERLGVDIPEIDYPRMSSLDGCVAYLGTKLGG